MKKSCQKSTAVPVSVQSWWRITVRSLLQYWYLCKADEEELSEAYQSIGTCAKLMKKSCQKPSKVSVPVQSWWRKAVRSLPKYRYLCKADKEELSKVYQSIGTCAKLTKKSCHKSTTVPVSVQSWQRRAVISLQQYRYLCKADEEELSEVYQSIGNCAKPTKKN